MMDFDYWLNFTTQFWSFGYLYHLTLIIEFGLPVLRLKSGYLSPKELWCSSDRPSDSWAQSSLLPVLIAPPAEGTNCMCKGAGGIALPFNKETVIVARLCLVIIPVTDKEWRTVVVALCPCECQTFCLGPQRRKQRLHRICQGTLPCPTFLVTDFHLRWYLSYRAFVGVH